MFDRYSPEDGFSQDDREAYRYMREIAEEDCDFIAEDIGEDNEILLQSISVDVDDSFWFN